MRTFAVPRTVDPKADPRYIRAPVRPPGGTLAWMFPFSREMSAPRARRPRMWTSMGRRPNTQPPGWLTSTRPWRARSGPRTQIEARMRRTVSYGAREDRSPEASISRSPLEACSVGAPRSRSREVMKRTSRSFGAPRRCTRPRPSSAPAIIGRTAFLAPAVRISPSRGRPPSTIIFFKPVPSMRSGAPPGGAARGAGGPGSRRWWCRRVRSPLPPLPRGARSAPGPRGPEGAARPGGRPCPARPPPGGESGAAEHGAREALRRQR